MQNAEVKTVLAFLAASWTAKPFDDATAAVWGQELAHYDFDAVMRVLRDLLRTSKWRPSLAEIVGPLSQRTVDTATAAFERIWEQIPKRPPKVTDLENRAVERLGGWVALRGWKLDERHWHFARFREVWADLQTELPKDRLQALSSVARWALPNAESVEPEEHHGGGYISAEQMVELARPLLQKTRGK